MGIYSHWLLQPNNTQIYIHPTGRDGETIDLIVKGNKVEFVQ